jgi:hypothetical protein
MSAFNRLSRKSYELLNSFGTENIFYLLIKTYRKRKDSLVDTHKFVIFCIERFCRGNVEGDIGVLKLKQVDFFIGFSPGLRILISGGIHSSLGKSTKYSIIDSR